VILGSVLSDSSSDGSFCTRLTVVRVLSVLESLLLLSGLFLFFLLGDAWSHSSASLLFAGAWLLVSSTGLWLLFKRAPPFVPTSRAVMNDMLALAEIRSGEHVYDLGCGDGRLVRAAAACGAQAVGIEFSFLTYLLARFLSRSHRTARIRFGNFWRQDYRNADVVFCFLLTDAMKEFERVIWPRLPPGCRVVSHAFRLPSVSLTRSHGEALLYVKSA